MTTGKKTLFAEKLKRLRRERGWTQDRLAQEVGIHGRHVGKYEIGLSMPSTDTLVKIADVFGVTVDFLLRDDDRLRSLRLRPLKNPDLMRKFEAVEDMPPEEQQVVMSLLDAFIKKHRIEAVLHD